MPLPTQHSTTTITDEHGNSVTGQTTDDRIRDQYANIGPNIANSMHDGMQSGLNDGGLRQTNANIGCLIESTFAVLGILIRWVWSKSKIAGLILILALIAACYFGFLYITDPYQFSAIFPSTVNDPTPTVEITPYTENQDSAASGAQSAAAPVAEDTEEIVTWNPCENTYASQLHPDMNATVLAIGKAVNMREGPGTDYGVVGTVGPGDSVYIMSDQPVCANGYIWWHIRSLKDGVEGWSVEGDSYRYWIAP